jgi:hypothetical protein
MMCCEIMFRCLTVNRPRIALHLDRDMTCTTWIIGRFDLRSNCFSLIRKLQLLWQPAWEGVISASSRQT